MKSGVVTMLLKVLDDKPNEEFPMEYHTLRALDNMTTCKDVATEVVEQGGIKSFIALLKSEDENVVVQAVRNIGQLAVFGITSHLITCSSL